MCIIFLCEEAVVILVAVHVMCNQTTKTSLIFNCSAPTYKYKFYARKLFSCIIFQPYQIYVQIYIKCVYIYVSRYTKYMLANIYNPFPRNVVGQKTRV